MNEDQFWQLIAAARAQANGDEYEVGNALTALLLEQPAADILEFDRWFYQHYFASYRADLWGAAFIMNGGCSDDGFDYFRGWLISQGRSVFEAALEHPDSLAEVVLDDAEADFGFENEDMLGLARRTWLEKTGLSDEEFDAKRGDFGTYPPLGEFEWSDGDGDIDEVKGKRLYPKLWAKFW
jgi:hypothetical protein